MPSQTETLEPDFADVMLSLLPERVAVAAVPMFPGDGCRLELFPEEAFAIRGAVERRRVEFATGRWCARAALRKLGGPRVKNGLLI